MSDEQLSSGVLEIHVDIRGAQSVLYCKGRPPPCGHFNSGDQSVQGWDSRLTQRRTDILP